MKKGYKNFNKYLYGVENWLKLLHDHLPTFYLRVYIDDSIIKNENYFNEIKKINKIYKNLQLVRFNCDNFKNEEYHKDLFPTLIRFLPLFQFSNNDTNYVLIRDLDVEKYNKNIKLLFSNYIEKFSKIKRKSGVIMNLIGYEPDHITKVNNKWGFNIMTPGLSTNIKLPISILNNFVDKLHKSNRKKLKYGVDEIFLNNVLLDYYIPYKNNIAIITPSYSFYYIQNSLSKSLHYSKHEKESKEVMRCKSIDQLRQFMNKYKSIVKDKYRKQLDNYNPNNIITNYYI
jgi:hypothetical protein